MECDFQDIQSTDVVVTRYFKMDIGRFVSETVRATFDYDGEQAHLQELYRNNQCYQSVQQLCQPWIQLTYEMERKINVTTDHRCQCLRYSQAVKALGNITERCVRF